MREAALQHLCAPGRPDTPLTLHTLGHEGDWITEGVLIDDAGAWWWIAGGVPRLLPPSLYRNPQLESRHAGVLRQLGLPPVEARSGRGRRVESATIDRFGAEWLQFRDWGHLEAAPAGSDPLEFRGGLWSDTLRAFESKTFLPGRINRRLVLDAGCGNGRFTRAALHHGAREVVAVDIGWGVEVAAERFRNDPRVHIVQATLFELPVVRAEVAFSLGVLMHTGDAERAFAAIAATVEPGGLMAVRMYHRGNWAHEVVDGSIRAITARVSKPRQQAFARRMAGFGRWLQRREDRRKRPGLRMRWYQVLRNHPTVHHNLDWWSAPVATHHTSRQVARWGEDAGLGIVRADPEPREGGYGFWEWPEALTILFERAPAAVPGQIVEHRPDAVREAAA